VNGGSAWCQLREAAFRPQLVSPLADDARGRVSRFGTCSVVCTGVRSGAMAGSRRHVPPISVPISASVRRRPLSDWLARRHRTRRLVRFGYDPPGPSIGIAIRMGASFGLKTAAQQTGLSRASEKFVDQLW